MADVSKVAAGLLDDLDLIGYKIFRESWAATLSTLRQKTRHVCSRSSLYFHRLN
jgi:hypothetical protein